VPYFYGNRGICIIWPASIPGGGITEGVLFGFWQGRHLKDADNYLTHGTNKKVYYNIFKAPAQINIRALKKLLKEAIEFDNNSRNSMSVIDKLATSLSRRNEIPNQELAKQIANSNDKKAVRELIENLNNKNKDIQRDCIKVIYEIGTLKPKLIVDFSKELVALLDNKNNRLQWGAMTALNTIANENPKIIYQALKKIIAVADKGSIITNDHCVGILIKLCATKEYAADAFSLLNERLKISPTNQLPMYAENALPIINDTNKATFIKTLNSRLPDIDKDAKRKRIEKVLRKLTK
jgi:hypothetical protein